MRRLAAMFLLIMSLSSLVACGEPSSASDAADGSNDTTAEMADPLDIAPASPPFDYCVPEQPPDEACWRDKRAPDSPSIVLARAIADKQLEVDVTARRWDWTETVLMVGLVELYRVTGDVRYRDYCQAWIDHHVEAGYVIGVNDTCAPTAVALALLEETGEARYQVVVDDGLRYLYEEAARTPEGGINHLGVNTWLGLSIWVDSLFMFGNVLTGWGRYADDACALTEYREQFDIFTGLLQEPPGFLRHAHGENVEQTPDVYWARGNAWVTTAGYDHLHVSLLRGEAVPSMEAALADQVAAIIDHQHAESGLWWTILNRPGETYLETSAAALFARGMARGYRYGFLGDEVLSAIGRAMAGVRARVTLDDQGRPVVTGTSGPTTVGSFESYANVEVADDIAYGVGAVLMALVETSGLPIDP
jgi:unsaturated rhamnogalacturonyl hydrolase